jgi:lambda repressor-like predicted transcriptional regulator
MTAPMPRPFAVAPLLALTATSLAALGRRAGLSGSTIAQARSRGLTVWEADRLACLAGFHPALVWPDWPDADQEVAA